MDKGTRECTYMCKFNFTGSISQLNKRMYQLRNVRFIFDPYSLLLITPRPTPAHSCTEVYTHTHSHTS